MEDLINCAEKVARLCSGIDPAQGIAHLQEELRQLTPNNSFKFVLTRGNWHRLGGVVDAEYQPVSDNLAKWAEEESEGEVEELVLRYMDAGYFATRLAGETHYFTLAFGESGEQFYQLEIEELQEVLERPLIDRDWYPESLEEFVDPLDCPRLEPEPIGKPKYQFRRITSVPVMLNEVPEDHRTLRGLRRFFRDWQQSSASSAARFCDHWVLALREYMDSDGERRLSAKPISVFAGDLPELPPGDDELSGLDLANAIRNYDRIIGFPFAWYFIMLSRKSANYALAEAVLRDQDGEYDYLPKCDLDVLRAWEQQPYGV